MGSTREQEGRAGKDEASTKLDASEICEDLSGCWVSSLKGLV